MKMGEIFNVGERNIIGSYEFTLERILDFAFQFDPQEFHIDEEAAKLSVLGGLCASGWHTASAWMRTFLEYMERENARLVAAGLTTPKLGPSPGFKKLRWIKPVYAGDVITYSATYQGTRPLSSRPGWYVVSHHNEGHNQKGELVFSFEGAVLEFD